MLDKIKNDAKAKMEKGINALRNELKKIRTGKAHISMLDNIKVNYYGTPTPLSQTAAISCPDPRSLMIAPWEPNLLKEIENSIIKSDLGMSPMNDGKVIRLKVPTVTEERRKDLVKTAKKMVEDARIAVRLVRRDINDEIKKGLKDKVLSEDQSKQLTEQVQKITDDFMEQIDKVSAEKEKDVMTI
ncbi:MAG: ribosome recycling factor [Pseudomonadota bacterium]|nr:ribosome recycling factor [Pseudomonadota bacterium]